MRRGLALVLLALASMVPASASADIFRRQVARNKSLPVLRILPAGSGQSHVVSLCDAARTLGLLEGPTALCLDGDGTSWGGGLPLSAVGGPILQTRSQCPSGPNCAAVTGARLDGVDDGYRTADVASPGGDFSACWLGSLDNLTGQKMLVAKDSSETGGRAFSLGVSGATLEGRVFSSDASSTAVTGGHSPTPRATHLVCLTYDFVSDGSSVLKLYFDGSPSGPGSTTAVGPVQAAAMTFVGVGYREYSGSQGWLRGVVRGALLTERVLSASQVQQLADATLGRLSGSLGEGLVYSRSSAASCESADGSEVTELPPGRPCVTQGGVAIRRQWTEILLRTSELDNAIWQGEALGAPAPTIVADTTDVAAPDGTYSAEKISFPAVTSAGNYSLVTQAFAASAAGYSHGLWLRTLSGTAEVSLQFSTGLSWSGHTRCVVTERWKRCTLNGQTLTAGTWKVTLGGDLRLGSGQSPISAATVYAWRWNAVQEDILPAGGAHAEGTAVTVSAESLQANLSGVGSGTPSVAVDYVHSGTSATLYVANLRAADGDEINLYVAGGVAYCCVLTDGLCSGGRTLNLPSIVMAAGGKYRLSCSYDGSTPRLCVDNTCVTSSVATTFHPSWTRFDLNYPGPTLQSNSLHGSACVGTDAWACR